MSDRERYKGFFIVPHSDQLKDATAWTAEFVIEEHDGAGVTETQFFLRETFLTRQAAVEAANVSARRKIDAGFHPNVGTSK